MISGSSILSKYIAWYDFRILCPENDFVPDFVPDFVHDFVVVFECASAPPGTLFANMAPQAK